MATRDPMFPVPSNIGRALWGPGIATPSSSPGRGTSSTYARFADPLADPAAGPLPAELIGGM
jgi:hypothetical protein